MDHRRIYREEGADLMVTQLEADPTDATHDTLEVFILGLVFLVKLYKNHVQWPLDAIGDDGRVEYHRHCELRCQLLFLVGTSMFADESETCVYMVYLKYFIDETLIHEYD